MSPCLGVGLTVYSPCASCLLGNTFEHAENDPRASCVRPVLECGWLWRLPPSTCVVHSSHNPSTHTCTSVDTNTSVKPVAHACAGFWRGRYDRSNNISNQCLGRQAPTPFVRRPLPPSPSVCCCQISKSRSVGSAVGLETWDHDKEQASLKKGQAKVEEQSGRVHALARRIIQEHEEHQASRVGGGGGDAAVAAATFQRPADEERELMNKLDFGLGEADVGVSIFCTICDCDSISTTQRWPGGKE